MRAFDLFPPVQAASEPALKFSGSASDFIISVYKKTVAAPMKHLVFERGKVLVIIAPFPNTPALTIWYWSRSDVHGESYRRKLSVYISDTWDADNSGHMRVRFSGAIAAHRAEALITPGTFTSMLKNLLDAVPAAFGGRPQAGSWAHVPATPATLPEPAWAQKPGHF